MNLISILEDNERWHDTDADLLCRILDIVDVEAVEVRSLSVIRCKLVENGRNDLAWAAPGGVEVDDCGTLGVNLCVWSQSTSATHERKRGRSPHHLLELHERSDIFDGHCVFLGFCGGGRDREWTLRGLPGALVIHAASAARDQTNRQKLRRPFGAYFLSAPLSIPEVLGPFDPCYITSPWLSTRHRCFS